jgi:hypothetical protein
VGRTPFLTRPGRAGSGRASAAYLAARIRPGSASFWAIGDAADEGIESLRRDLETGAWTRRYAELLAREDYDAGYRLVAG